LSTTVQKTTAEQLFGMPDDGFRHELIKGELKTMAPAGFDHGVIIMNLAVPLGQYVKANNLGVVLGAETGFKIETDPDTVRAPDIAFVRRDRIPPTGRPAEFWPGAPDLAVEVLSPGDTVYEVEERIADWLSAGTSAVWVINPKRHTAHIHRSQAQTQTLTEKDTLDGQDVVPGFRLSVAEVFI
jgi:Uma2 family endonuclease